MPEIFTEKRINNIMAQTLQRLVDSTASLSIDSFTDEVPNALILAILGNLEDARKVLATRRDVPRS